MKIAIICTLYPPYILGGAEISISLLAKGLVQNEHEVIVITTGEESKREIVENVVVYRIKNKNIYWRFPQRDKSLLRKTIWHFIDIYNPLYSSEIKHILSDFKPDIVNTSNLCGLSTCVWKIVKDLNIPIVHTLRDYYLLCPQQTMIKGTQSCEKQCSVCYSYSVVKKLMSQKVDALVGISDFISKHHLKYGFFKNAQLVETIANSVEGKVLPKKEKTFSIGYIGRLSPEKGIEFLIEAFRKSTISRSYRLQIAGTGNNEYETFLKDKYSSDNISFVGHKKTKEFFDTIDLLVVPSLWNEPFGRVVIEAYASNCPVFMSMNGGLKELQVDGISWCFDTQSTSTLVHLFNDFANSRMVIMDDLFSNVLSQYSQQVITGKYLHLFKEVIKNRK